MAKDIKETKVRSALPTLNTIGNVGAGSANFQDFKFRVEKPNFLNGVHLPFTLVALFLVLFGLVVCYSAVMDNAEYSFKRQLMGLAIGLILSICVYKFNYLKLEKLAIPLLVVSVIMILSPHIPGIGYEAMGAKSWVKIGIQFQPGEFAKVTVILFAASLISKFQGRLDSLKEYCKAVGMLAIPFLCILTQPDLGTGLVYLSISAVVIIVGGAKMRYVVATVIVIVVSFLLLLGIDEILKTQSADGTYEYKLLKNYQRSRLFVFLNQDTADSSSDGYNLQQAMIAIGSGGAFGKGLGQATQSTLGFLPEAPTDFIFCVLAEELGFFGVICLLVLYALLIFFTIRIGHSSGSMFGMLICIGVSAMWLFQVLENVGMCCGVMPITGIPLPFVSYGSSFMIVNFVCLGLVANVWKVSKKPARQSMQHSKDVNYA